MIKLNLVTALISAVLATGAAASSAVDKAHSQITEDLIEWVRSEGGYFSHKLEIRRMDPEDEASPFGVFAKDDILKDETLIKVPRNCYISLEKDEIQDTAEYEKAGGEDMETIMSIYFGNTCRLAHKYLEKMKAYQTSKNKTEVQHGPYLAYLETQQRGQLPATYTEAAKRLLRKIVGQTDTLSKNYGYYALPPYKLVDWIDEHFKKTGCIAADDPLEEHAVALAIQRGYDFEFVPIWDMVNHDNLNLNTDNNAIHSEEGLKVWATMHIPAGSEVYATYNFCTDCKDVLGEDEFVGDEWGTPGIFRDFGFVEQSVQLWPFLDHNIYFELEFDDETGEEEHFGFDEDGNGNYRYGKPDEEGLRFLQEQLERLEGISDDLKERPEDIPEYQWENIKLFYTDMLRAIRRVTEETIKLNNSDELSSSSTREKNDTNNKKECAKREVTSEEEEEVCSA